MTTGSYRHLPLMRDPPFDIDEIDVSRSGLRCDERKAARALKRIVRDKTHAAPALGNLIDSGRHESKRLARAVRYLA